MKLETLAVRARHAIDSATGAVAPAIHLSTTFERATDGSFPHGYIYTRGGNPNRDALEVAVATLEGGAAAAGFASGSAATGVLQALRPGDHVIAPDDVYHGTRRILCTIFARWNIEASFVDMTDLAQVEAVIRPNICLFWVETPSNPRLKISDIAAIAELAHASGARCVCDNTWATPVLQPPFDCGADLVVHSTTKYLGGHSDVLGGAVVTQVEDDFWAQVRAFQTDAGAVPSPFECWLVLRSIPTLPYRMRAHTENAHKLARFLSEHPKVTAAHYPGLQDDPGHVIASRQMTGFGGMLSFEVVGGQREAMAVAAKVKLFTRATSLGGVESLIEHRASIEGPGSPTPSNLLRLSVGLEHADDLIEDLAQALA